MTSVLSCGMAHTKAENTGMVTLSLDVSRSAHVTLKVVAQNLGRI